MECKICNSKSDFFAETSILFKYNVKYFQCSNCLFIQTEEPYWLDEAYSEAINYSDIGLLKRNIDLLNPTKAVIKLFFDKNGKFLDYGAGYGIFVRLMRDGGFDFYWSDKYCNNLFAKEFEHVEHNKYDLLTAYEVFEHLVNPIDEIIEMLKYSDNILFSTYILPHSNPKPGEWWYFTPDHGQHISIYSKNSLRIIAEKFSLNFYSNNKNLHLFSKKKISKLFFGSVTFPYAAELISPILRRKSLLDNDYSQVLEKLKRDS